MLEILSLFWVGRWTSVRAALERCQHFCGVLVFFCAVLFGQNNTGELRLTVSDQSGAPIAAQAELVSQASKTQQTVTLSKRGRYSFKNLPFGLYVLTVTEEGFAPSSSMV